MPGLAISTAHEHEPTFGDYVALLKPRVMSLVVFTALVGLLVAPASLHAVEAVAAMLFIALGAGAAGALNMWYDADIDSVMRRTMKRPVPSGRVAPEEARAIGVGLSGLSVVMLGLATNMLAATLLAVTISFYVVVYTMWLKRRTPQNIVIGGAAGAFPPMIGWVAATGSVSLEACLMFALIFMWTPPHFWALALFMRSDYEDAGVPMLTVTHGRTAARRHILAYTLLLVPVSFWLALGPIGGPASLAAAVVLNLMFVWGAFQLCRRTEAVAQGDGYAAEKAFFRASLFYLFLHFGAFLADAVVRQAS
ncbi:MAG: protoheme IX farnesyltransferase [Boseongicola sp. SB0675_bin_26]|nr:protoheme IX farnesyltransferase [Boseongicola sp. SB0675_bin_26]